MNQPITLALVQSAFDRLKNEPRRIKTEIVTPAEFEWRRLLNQLDYMVRAANQSGLRMPARRGRGYQWCVYPREYLQLTQKLGQAPEWVRVAVRGITA